VQVAKFFNALFVFEALKGRHIIVSLGNVGILVGSLVVVGRVVGTDVGAGVLVVKVGLIDGDGEKAIGFEFVVIVGLGIDGDGEKAIEFEFAVVT
jgi:hypothetical protein